MTISVEAVATSSGSSRRSGRGRAETRALVGDRGIDLVPVAAGCGQFNHGSGAGGADVGPACLGWDDSRRTVARDSVPSSYWPAGSSAVTGSPAATHAPVDRRGVTAPLAYRWVAAILAECSRTRDRLRRHLSEGRRTPLRRSARRRWSTRSCSARGTRLRFGQVYSERWHSARQTTETAPSTGSRIGGMNEAAPSSISTDMVSTSLAIRPPCGGKAQTVPRH